MHKVLMKQVHFTLSSLVICLLPFAECEPMESNIGDEPSSQSISSISLLLSQKVYPDLAP
uniref:Uncharacterized protein n=1 Tax=Rhizophora mucronata TaxID=61149 RepID=A0A2P2JE06_RHIMU